MFHFIGEMRDFLKKFVWKCYNDVKMKFCGF